MPVNTVDKITNHLAALDDFKRKREQAVLLESARARIIDLEQQLRWIKDTAERARNDKGSDSLDKQIAFGNIECLAESALAEE